MATLSNAFFGPVSPVRERLEGTSDLFLVADFGSHPALKLVGIITVLVQLATVLIIWISFSLDDEALESSKKALDHADYVAAIPIGVIFALLWMWKDVADAVWLLGQQPSALKKCGVARMMIALSSLMLTMYYAAVRSHGYELAVEIVTVLLVVDLDEKVYGACKATIPGAVSDLETWVEAEYGPVSDGQEMTGNKKRDLLGEEDELRDAKPHTRSEETAVV